jgi:shikimate kinase
VTSLGPGEQSAATEAAARESAPSATSVVVIGFMGSGKSHVGTLLSRQLRLPFVDTDRLVEAEHGPIETIFAELGEAEFRELERDVVLQALAGLGASPAVVSLGGGAVSDGDVRAALRAASYVAWLSAPVDVLWRRVRRAARRSGGGRPLAADEASFRALYEERLPFYREVATAEFRNDGDHSAAEVAEWVASSVQGAVS